MGSNALNALLSKVFSERSEDFSAAQRRESIGIFAVWVGRPGGPVCRPYENTKACPVNAVGADDLGARGRTLCGPTVQTDCPDNQNRSPHPSRCACHLPLKGKARAADSRPYMYPEAILSLS